MESPCSSNGAAQWMSEMGMEDPALFKHLDSLFSPASSDLTSSTGPGVSKTTDVLPSTISDFPLEHAKKTDVLGSVVNPSTCESLGAITKYERPQKLPKLICPDAPSEQLRQRNGVSMVQSSGNGLCMKPFMFERGPYLCQRNNQSEHQYHHYHQQERQYQHHRQQQQHRYLQKNQNQKQQSPMPNLQQQEDFLSLSSRLRGINSESISLSASAFQLEVGPSRRMISQESQITDSHSTAARREAPLSSGESVHGSQNSEFHHMQKMCTFVDNNPTAPSKTLAHTQDHIMAERKRREKLSQRFIALSAILPGLKKLDKASVLGDAIKYVKDLQARLVTLEEQAGRKMSMAVVKSSPVEVDAERLGTYDDKPVGLYQPEIEVRISGRNVLIRLHCDKMKGLLVKALVELENLQLSVANANILSFSDTTLDLTFSAQMEHGCELTVDDIVKALQDFFRRMK